MTIYDLMYLFVDDGLQTVRVYDLLSEEYIYTGRGDELPTEISECEIMSIDCLPNRKGVSGKNDFDEQGYAILTINVEKGGN